MVARGWADRVDTRKLERAADQAHAGGESRCAVDAMFIQNESVSVCLLLNRRTKTMRVIDFRAGPSHAKRVFVLKLAAREGIEKVYTVVERDEVSTWMKLGFAKEANIPGFYKRSDAFILGTDVEAALAGNARFPLVGDEDDDPPTEEPSPAHDFAEKTLVLAKKHAKELLDRPLPATRLAIVSEGDVKKAVERAVRSGRALSAFEPFGRDVERRYFHLTSRGNFELVASTESQSCFGNAFLELLTGPKTEAERLATVAALRALCEKLVVEGIVSCFALAPSDDVALATAFAFNGFRRTGLLLGHLHVGGERKDAIVWSRKLANPASD